MHVLMTYQLAGGSAAERAAARSGCRRRPEPSDAEHVLVTPGAQAALAAVILACWPRPATPSFPSRWSIPACWPPLNSWAAASSWPRPTTKA
ncbi:hypothetical protein WJ970_15270 [Achromobacter xylosoxidans]